LAGRRALGGTVAILVAASVTLTGCAGSADSSDTSSAADAPGSAVENSFSDDRLQLTLVNETGQQFTAWARIGCYTEESYDVSPGGSATFSPSRFDVSRCLGVGKGGVILASGERLPFLVDNYLWNPLSVEFSSGGVSKKFRMPADVNPGDRYCLGDWTVAGTSFEAGDPLKFSVTLGQKADVAGDCKVV